MYSVRMREITNDEDNESAGKDDEDDNSKPKKRKTKTDSRAQIQPASGPELGFNTLLLDQAIAGGPAGLRKAQKTALHYAKQFQEEATDYWRKETDWLKNSDGCYRAHARYALVWRPRFLAALSMCHSVQLACRHVRVSPDTAYYHRSHDPQFAEQWDKARDHGIEMLHARVFQRALEGDTEPVFHAGVPVGYIRKYSDKLQIELLRAYKPDTFKTPGTNINLATRGDVFMLTEEQRHELMAINREFLLNSPLPTDNLTTCEDSAPTTYDAHNANPNTPALPEHTEGQGNG
jgi:hypothetical protein